MRPVAGPLAAFFVLSLCFSRIAVAQELVDPRVVGMGGVATAFADDSTAPQENPAALWQLQRWRLEAVAATFMFSEGLAIAPAEIDRITAGSEEEARAAAQRLVGQNATASGAFHPSFTMKGFGVGLLANAVADARLRNSAYPRIEGKAGAIGGLVAGGAYGFVDDAVSIGMSLSIGKRAQFVDVVGPATIAHGTYDFKAVTREGFGVVGTFGVQIIGPFEWAPRIGVTVKNAFGFNISDPAPIFEGPDYHEYRLENVPPEVAVAVGTSKQLGPVRLRLGLGHDDIKTTESPFLHLHAGAETTFWGLISARAGLWQGYVTGGLGLDFRYVRLEAATYEVERGAYAGQHGDRRFVFQLALGV